MALTLPVDIAALIDAILNNAGLMRDTGSAGFAFQLSALIDASHLFNRITLPAVYVHSEEILIVGLVTAGYPDGSVWAFRGFKVEKGQEGNVYDPEDPRLIILFCGPTPTVAVLDRIAVTIYSDIECKISFTSGAYQRGEIQSRCRAMVGTSGTPLFIANQDELFAMALMPNVDRDIVFGSILLNIFPHTRGIGASGVRIYPIDEFHVVTGLTLLPIPSGPGTGREYEALVALYSHLILGAYNHSRLLQRQVVKRLNAIFQQAQIKEIQAGEFPTSLAHLINRGANLQGPILEMIGMVVATDSEGRYNPEIVVTDLGPVETLKALWGLDAALCSLLTGMRLVYENSHSTTIRWGAAAALRIRDSYHLDGPPWDTELPLGIQLHSRLMNRPYMGLRTQLPESLRVAAIPNLCAVGVRYEELCHRASGDQETFSLFAISAIEDHLKTPEDKAKCQMIAALLPQTKQLAIADLLSMARREQWPTIEAKMEPEDRPVILGHLLQFEPPCAWARVQQAKLERMALDKFLNHLTTRVVPVIHQVLSQLQGDMALAESAAERERLRKVIMSAQTKVDTYTKPLLETATEIASDLEIGLTQHMSWSYEGLRELLADLRRNRDHEASAPPPPADSP